ncbi:hypothetical protein ACIBJC_15185 [Streptomyces sp. NPDC050509]|uniref:hypothetical protein n=1 Tax=Streptomyces sp. NPDC050509 TaxID=3365620 RepID=UPI0037B24FF7
MHFTVVQTWAITHPWPALGIIAALLALTTGVLWYTVRSIRRAAAPVAVAAVGAIVCTIYSADTSWRFAGTNLGMTDVTERAVMFGAGELALLACAVMARANKLATATETDAGTGGTPGVLVWVVTAVQVVACYSTSGFTGGTVRAIIGPIMAALLWHLAMGLEIRVATPGALSSGLAAQIGRDLRERLLSRLGLATRDRTAEQISRDRAIARVVRLASRRWLSPWGRASLAAAVARSGAGTNPQQYDRLMHQLAARRSADQLTTLAINSPWRAPEYPASRVPVPAAVVNGPGPYPALPAPPPDVVPAGAHLLPIVPPGPAAEVPVPEIVPAGTRLLPLMARPAPEPAVQHAPARTTAAAPTRPMVHAEYVPEVPVPALPEYPLPQVPDPAGQDDPAADEEVPEGDLDVPDPDPLIERARADFGTEIPGVARLKKAYGIGQARAQRIRDAIGSPV